MPSFFSKPPLAPSVGLSLCVTLNSFLANSDYRKLYCQHLGELKRWKYCEANNWFLRECVERKVIPQSFLTKTTAKSQDPEYLKAYEERNEAFALNEIAEALEKDKKKEEELLNALLVTHNKLRENIPRESIANELEERLKKKAAVFRQEAQKKYEKKLKFLQAKTKETSKDTLASDDQKQQAAPKKRKWVKKSKYKRQQKKKRKAKISVVFNYSKALELTPAMEALLNRGLNYSITPLNLNMSQVVTDFAKFEKNCEWTEYWSEEEPDPNYKPPLFKKQSTKRPPKSHPRPAALKTYLSAVRSEIEDPLNRNKIRPNLPPEEKTALAELIKLQKERKIVIKPCDKGAGLIILDFPAYMTSCYNHLKSGQVQPDGSVRPFYVSVDSDAVDAVKVEIGMVLAEGHEAGYITEEEKAAMDASDKKPAKFYETFKVHKKHEPGETPPERPIISGSGSFTENIGKFAESHLKDLACDHPMYLKDTPHLLRQLEELNNSGQPLEDDTLLVTIDVSAMYSNIPQDEALQACKDKLDRRADQSVPSNFIIRLMEIILKNNIFEFNKELFLQIIGIAMGSKPSVSIANIFMSEKVDQEILNIAKNLMEEEVTAKTGDKKGDNQIIRLILRFIDDLLLTFRGSYTLLHSFFTTINSIHPAIKFTMDHTTLPGDENPDCGCPARSRISFLDTELRLEAGRIESDLYRKPSDRNMYLLPSSCHPNHVTESTMYSCALRVVRICSREADRDKRFEELKQLLVQRDYKPKQVDSAIARARQIPRTEAIKEMTKERNTRPVLSIQYDPVCQMCRPL